MSSDSILEDIAAILRRNGWVCYPPGKYKDHKLAVDIRSLDISVRAMNGLKRCLQHFGYHGAFISVSYIRELIESGDLLKTSHMGIVSVREVKEALDEYEKSHNQE